MTSVPTIAWLAPPPSPITPRADSVKKATSKRLMPLLTTVKRSEASGIIASPNAEAMLIVINRSLARREPSTERDQA